MAIRLHVTAEGETEERFVKSVLAPYLGEKNVWTDSRCVLTHKDKRASVECRGGFRRQSPYTTVKKDIFAWMKEDMNPDARFTTMFDLSALPGDFPEYAASSREADPYRRVAALEQALAADINGGLNDTRFIPYIQLHEFEALILADPQKLDWEFLEHDKPIRRLVEMVAREGDNPELIDDGDMTAPSKRIIAEIAEYAGNKATSGPLVVSKIGLPTLLRRCQHFEGWINDLVRGAGHDSA